MQTKSALTAIILAALAIAGQAHADTVVRFPPKGGIPYSVYREDPRIEQRTSVHHAEPNNGQQHHVGAASLDRQAHHEKRTSY